jgi:galactokinase/mevalonate kinase-like predicted kinase
MSIHFSIPARVNILGNPTDGNEGAYATISAAVDIRAHGEIEPHENHILDLIGASSSPIKFHPADLPLPYNGPTDLLKAAVNRLFSHSQEFNDKISESGFHLRIWSDVPRQSGLGGSSLFVLLTLAAMREFYDLDRRIHNNYYLAELAQRVEEKEIGITCGYADRYVPLFGGLAYLDYHGKLEHASIGDEPYATYERLDELVETLPLIALVTGVRHDSADVHGRMRPRYIAEYKEWQGEGGEMPPMVSFMSATWDCAWRGKIALLGGNLSLFGQLMDENHQLVDKMMRYCGFEDGAGWANNLFIKAAKDNGSLGAKLTGAGGGGSVFALVNPGDEVNFINMWQETARKNKLNKAQVFNLSISPLGLTIDHK